MAARKTTTAPQAEASAPAASEAAEEVVQTIKGLDADLKCRGFQFAVGESYTHDGLVVICESGFHGIEGHPLKVLHYYSPSKSRYALTTQSGSLARQSGDGKLASARITIDAEIALPALIERAVKWVFDRVNPEAKAHQPNGAATASGDYGAATASGHYGAATASGDYGAATASGHSGAATASGHSGAATASGYSGAATASGHSGAATASGHSGAATASGHSGRARGAKGCALFLVYRDEKNGAILHVWAGVAGKDGIKPMTFYALDKDGKPQEIA
jgi:hypothetical protein